MKKTLKPFFILILVLLMLSTLSSAVFATDTKDVLTFSVSTDGYAIVSDCDQSAQGVVEIPSVVTINGINYTVKFIGNKAFDGCYSVTQISIPEGVTAIFNHAFRDCISLTDVYVPSTLVVCQYDAFDGCRDVTVHCYTSNYQFFSVYGISANLNVNILDKDETEDVDKEDENTSSESTDLITRLVNAIRNLVQNLRNYFNSNSDFEDKFFDFEDFGGFDGLDGLIKF